MGGFVFKLQKGARGENTPFVKKWTNNAKKWLEAKAEVGEAPEGSQQYCFKIALHEHIINYIIK